jgi:putative FmdB family regulatory protein
MPLYEFRCESCGWTLETILAFSDPLPSTCEACGGALKKLLSAPAFQFKGSGWYLTDYGRGGGGEKPKEAGAAPSEKGGEAGAAPAVPTAPAEAGSSSAQPPASSGEGGAAAKKGDA